MPYNGMDFGSGRLNEETIFSWVGRRYSEQKRLLLRLRVDATLCHIQLGK